MFTKRKKIVIGETYLFDILNETNLAPFTSLVTVIKKAKHNKYTVISVNNGDVFEVDSKFLIPYVNPKDSSVVRCHYGTTEFNDKDIMCLEYIDLAMDLFNDLVYGVREIKDKDPELAKLNYNDIIDAVKSSKAFISDTKNKIQKYVNISNYKDIISVIHNKYSEINNLNKEYESPSILKNKPLENEFSFNFEKNVEKYLDEEIDISDFINKSKNIIEKFYPRYLLLNNNSRLSIRQVNDIISGILENTNEIDGVAIIIGMDDKDNWHIKSICLDKGSDNRKIVNDLIRYVYELYPSLKEKGYCNPKYRFNVITVNKNGDKNYE